MQTPRKQPRQQRSRETVDIVLEAAAQVFVREGIGATTNRIAERAGVSIGTVYQYFPNKQALLYAIAERHVAAVRARLATVFADLRAHQPPFAETVRVLVTEVVALHGDRPELHRVLEQYAPRVPDGVREVEALREWCVREVAFHLTRCGRTGPDLELSAQALVDAVDRQVHRGQAGDRLVEAVLDLATRMTDDTGSRAGRHVQPPSE